MAIGGFDTKSEEENHAGSSSICNDVNNAGNGADSGPDSLIDSDINPDQETSPIESRMSLSIESVLDLWSKTYNTNGKPDWSHLFPYYHPDIIFQDSIQRVEGIEDFKALCTRLTNRCKQLQMDIISIAEGHVTNPAPDRNSRFIIMDWKMTMSFRKSPNTPIFGCTKLTFHEDGRIIEQRDYYDLWGDIFNGIPKFGRLYRKFMHKYFG